MANGPTLPPQAYTREILTAAFNWLQSQPESVRKLATTPDALVGLYMRAQRYGHSTLESDAPVSGQSFMSDLKSLAEGLKQFEQPAAPAHSAPPQNYSTNQQQNSIHSAHSAHSSFLHNQARQVADVAPTATFHAAQMSAPPPLTQQMAAQLTSQMQAQIPLQTPSTLPNAAMLRAQIQQQHQQQSVGHGVQLNEMSQRMIQEVKTHLNLSSDIETINMMLALAYKNLKNLIG